MNVIIAQEARETDLGCYHLLNDAKTASLCGSINEESQFASSSSQTLSRETAERRGFDVCGRCSYIVETRSVAKSGTDD